MAVKRVLKHLLWIIPLLIVIAAAGLALNSRSAKRAEDDYHAPLAKSLQVRSGSFQHEQQMPAQYSCRGAGISPQIQWAGAPGTANSFALVSMDWDAPSPSLRLFPVVHWVVYNIPKNVTEIPENATVGVAGRNLSGATSYLPPCPPLGVHRYVFRVYALDVNQIQPESNDKAGVMKAMEGHVVGYGELTGLSGG